MGHREFCQIPYLTALSSCVARCVAGAHDETASHAAMRKLFGDTLMGAVGPWRGGQVLSPGAAAAADADATGTTTGCRAHLVVWGNSSGSGNCDGGSGGEGSVGGDGCPGPVATEGTMSSSADQACLRLCSFATGMWWDLRHMGHVLEPQLHDAEFGGHAVAEVGDGLSVVTLLSSEPHPENTGANTTA